MSIAIPRYRVLLRYQWPALLVVLLGSLVVFLFSFLLHRTEQRDLQFRIASDARDYQHMLRLQLQGDLRLMRDAAGFFSNSPVVTQQAFNRYLTQVAGFDSQTGLTTVAYLAQVPLHGQEGRRAAPAGARYPATYLYPGNSGRARLLIGQDFSRQPGCRKAMTAARDTAQPVLTGPIPSIVDPGSRKILIFTPVYQDGLFPRNIAARRLALRGYLAASVRIDALVSQVLGEHFRKHFDLEIDDISVQATPQRLYQSRSAAGQQGSYAYQDALLFAGHTWRFTFRPRPGYYQRFDQQFYLLALLLGQMVVFCLALTAWHLANRRRAQQQYAEQSLHFQSLFEQHPDAVYSFDLSGRFLTANQRTLDLLQVDYVTLCRDGFQKYVAAEDLTQVLAHFQAAIGGRSQNYETTVINARGERIIANVTNLPIIINGATVGVFGIAYNITERRQAEKALIRTQQFLNAIIDNIPSLVFVKDARSLKYLLANKASEDLAGITRTEIIGKCDHDLFPEDTAGFYLTKDREVLASRGLVDIPEEILPTRYQGHRLMHARKVAILDEHGEPEYLLGVAEDITEQKQAQQLLEESHQRYKSLYENHPDAVFSLDGKGHFTSCNPQCLRLAGYAQEVLLGRPFLGMVVPEDQEKVLQHFYNAMDGDLQSYECRLKHQDSRTLLLQVTNQPIISGGEVVGVHGIARDITQARQNENRLAYLARYDALTGLPNRRNFEERLIQAMVTERPPSVAALLYLDLDRFKEINDTHGHETGSQILISVASRLIDCLERRGMIARLEGDQFAILMDDLPNKEAAGQLAEQILAALSRPFRVDALEFFLSGCIGIALYPDGRADARELLMDADLAMYQAKARGQNNYAYYSVEMKDRLTEEMALVAELRHALARNELEVNYQPLVDTKSLAIDGVEALLRWNSPSLGSVAPERFIPLAEEAGFIVPIGRWILQTACRQLKTWQQAGFPKISVSINVSMRQLRERNFVQVVREVLQACALEPQYLELELTESLLMQDVEDVTLIMQELRALGVRFAIDDFGTGYSSLSYLKHLPIHSLKIDRSFVANIISEPDDAAIVNATLAMARKMKLKVTAEGVETQSQLDFLRLNDCDKVQGFYFSPPVAADAMARLLEERRTWQQGGAQNDSSGNTLLIVDDEANITASLRRALRRDNYHILVAHSAAEGFELLASHPVGVILSDQRMPQMSGTEFLSRVRELYPKTVRMVLSGYTELNSITQAINRGAIYKYLTKPWETEELRETVREAFYRYRQRNESAETTLIGS